MVNDFFDASVFNIEPAGMSALFPYLVLCLGIALTVVSSAFRVKASRQIFLTNSILLTFIFLLFSRMGSGVVEVFGSSLSINDEVRFVGIGVSVFAVLSSLFMNSARDEKMLEEWAPVMLIAVLAFSLIPAARDLVAFFVYLETAAICSYILAALNSKKLRGLEGGLKYLMLGAFSTAIFVMGSALLYGLSGSFKFEDIFLVGRELSTGIEQQMLFVGAALVFSSLAFKVALVPFHMWAPDVYQASPAAVASFLATASKLAIFAGLIHFFSLAGFQSSSALLSFVKICAIASIIGGSLLAIAQSELRRMLAYSSIVNSGYAGLNLLTVSSSGGSSILIFFFIYGLGAIASFAMVEALVISQKNKAGEDISYHEIGEGVSFSRSINLFVYTLALFSLAGIPPLPGFFGKYLLLRDLWSGGEIFLSGFIVLGSFLGLAYYLRSLVPFYLRGGQPPGRIAFSDPKILAFVGLLVVFLMTVVVVNFSRLPNLLESSFPVLR